MGKAFKVEEEKIEEFMLIFRGYCWLGESYFLRDTFILEY